MSHILTPSAEESAQKSQQQSLQCLPKLPPPIHRLQSLRLATTHECCTPRPSRICSAAFPQTSGTTLTGRQHTHPAPNLQGSAARRRRPAPAPGHAPAHLRAHEPQMVALAHRPPKPDQVGARPRAPLSARRQRQRHKPRPVLRLVGPRRAGHQPHPRAAGVPAPRTPPHQQQPYIGASDAPLITAAL
jgi:hypothetical protein